MKKVVFIIFSVLLLIGVFFRNATAASIPTPTFDPRTLSTYELFWPLVAGKTIDDPVYFIKNLRERVEGLIIFGSPQKADYEVLLVTKRVIEAEKLINERKIDSAGKTLQRAEKSLNNAILLINKALSGEVSFQEQAVNISNRLSNLEVFIPRLMEKDEKDKEILTRILEKVTLLKIKL